jgi:hypothetical protein
VISIYKLPLFSFPKNFIYITKVQEIFAKIKVYSMPLQYRGGGRALFDAFEGGVDFGLKGDRIFFC